MCVSYEDQLAHDLVEEAEHLTRWLHQHLTREPKAIDQRGG